MARDDELEDSKQIFNTFIKNVSSIVAEICKDKELVNIFEDAASIIKIEYLPQIDEKIYPFLKKEMSWYNSQISSNSYNGFRFLYISDVILDSIAKYFPHWSFTILKEIINIIKNLHTN